MKPILVLLCCLCSAGQGFAQNEFVVNTRRDTTQREPRIACDAAGNPAVVWSSRNQAGPTSSNDICLQMLTPGGAPIGVETLVNQATAGSQEQPAMAMNARGDLVVAWASSTSIDSAFDIKARVYRKNQAPSPELLVNTTVQHSQCHPTVDIDSSGRFVIVWDSWYQDGGDRGVYARQFAADGTPLGPEFPVNVTTAYSQARPAVRFRADGTFVVVWESWDQDGGTPAAYGIYGRLWNANGTPLGGEFRVNTTVNDYQWFADVETFPDNSMVVVWCSWEQDGADGAIILQRLAPDGQKTGGEVAVNQTTEYYQWLPRVRRMSGGGCAVAWSSWKQDGDREGVYVRMFDAAGSPVSYETQMNTTAASYQWEPDIVAAGPDAVMAVWSSWGQLGKDFEVVGRKVTARKGMGYLEPSTVGHTAGRSTTQLIVRVIDSTAFTGHTYEAKFDSVNPRSWHLNVRDVSTGDTVVTRYPVDKGENVFYLSPSFHGVALQVIPEFDLELRTADSYFLNRSGATLGFAVYPSTIGARQLVPVDVAIIWGSTDTLAGGAWITPLDTAINTSGQRVVVTPFRAWNLTENNRVDLLVVDSRADQRWNPGEKIVIRTPLPYRQANNSTHAEVWTLLPSGPLKLPVTGDTMKVLTTRPLRRDDLYRFTPQKSLIVSAEDLPRGGFSLSQNYPNPFNPSTAIRFELASAGKVMLRVFDILGREVVRLVDESRPAGEYTERFDGSGRSSGVYFCLLEVEGRVVMRKMVLVK